MNGKFTFLLIYSTLITISNACTPQNEQDNTLLIKKSREFSIDGKGSANEWDKTEWINIPQWETTSRMTKNPAPLPADPLPPEKLNTRAKILYSNTGIYFLFQCKDRKLQATMKENFKEIWWEDVVEIFLWPDENDPVYYEYQVSPLEYIRITQHGNGKSTLQPLYGENDLQVYYQTSVKGGTKESGASISQWTAEVYVPFALIQPVKKIPPDQESQWRINLYRFDFDTGNRTRWEWQLVQGKNHEKEKFGILRFE